ncbi:hypothetical protein FBR05_01610 [Deltaproteobacteria bacterium PRO3]|nr:hypothetical protein [Deltaproteobacteria bacterium PRO3]
MSTKQLVVLWYGGILMFLLLLVKVSSTVTLGIGAGLLALLLIYTLSRHHRANKGQVLLAIGFPMMLLGIVSFVAGDSVDDPTMYWQAGPARLISPDQVQVLDLKVRRSFFSDVLSGKIQNNSTETVRAVTLKVLSGGDAKTAETWQVRVGGLNLAPGAGAPFAERIGDFHLKWNRQIPWSFQVLAAEAQ